MKLDKRHIIKIIIASLVIITSSAGIVFLSSKRDNASLYNSFVFELTDNDKEYQIDKTIFSKEAFQNLKNYNKNSVEPEIVGKNNIFVITKD
ncbi:hypothetical protein K9M42_00040 [Patescibacteria group bacterium]|nr:hypothetical protein [Patescibacteria group bacterium]